MLMLACQVKYLCHLRVSDVVGIDTARTDTLIMDLKHDPSGGLAVLTEYPLQYVSHELHRSVVVIQEPYFAQ
jgi:hypothetical protein